MNVQYKSDNLEKWVDQKAHNWLIHQAFVWLQVHAPHLLPKELDERYVQYGAAFADYPWYGRPESFAAAPEGGQSVKGVRDNLDGHTVGSDCVGLGNDYCVEARYWKKINLYLAVRWMASYIVGAVRETSPVDQLGHYPNNTLLRLDGTEGRSDQSVTNCWEIKGNVYGTQLYELARSFWSELEPEPDMHLLPKRSPGSIFIRHLIPSLGHASVTLPATCLGANPYIPSSNSSPFFTWPVWVPEKYNPEVLLAQHPGRIKRAASIYLGWALHIMHDLGMPFHAMNRFGRYHLNAEDELDAWIGEGKFNHLPVTDMPSMGGATKYRFSKKTAYWPGFYGEFLRPDYCRKFSLDAYGGYSVEKGELPNRFVEVSKLAGPLYNDVHPGNRSSQAASIAAWEYILDLALKNTIMMIACLQRNMGFRGVVSDSSGNLLKDAELTFTSEDEATVGKGKTDSKGEFVVRLSKHGNYNLTIKHPRQPDHTNCWYVLNRGGFRLLNIRIGDKTSPNGLYGKVYLVLDHFTRNPLRNAVVEATSGNFKTSTTTNNSGGFKIGIHHPGDYMILVTSPAAEKPIKMGTFKVGEGYLFAAEINMKRKATPHEPEETPEPGSRRQRN